MASFTSSPSSVLFVFQVLSTIASCLCQFVDAYKTLPYNFTLGAVNTTLSNANFTGVPLVLGQAGAIVGESFYVTSTYASYPYNDYPSLGLINNTLRAYTRSGAWITNTTDVQSGSALSWGTSTLYTQPDPPIFSAIRIPTYECPLLAVHGFADLWSLCPFAGTRPQTNVIFNVSADNTSPPLPYLGFDPADCYGVVITILPS